MHVATHLCSSDLNERAMQLLIVHLFLLYWLSILEATKQGHPPAELSFET